MENMHLNTLWDKKYEHLKAFFRHTPNGHKTLQSLTFQHGTTLGCQCQLEFSVLSHLGLF